MDTLAMTMTPLLGTLALSHFEVDRLSKAVHTVDTLSHMQRAAPDRGASQAALSLPPQHLPVSGCISHSSQAEATAQ